jgi:hypothetical protein
MALTNKSIDELVTEMVDTYDELLKENNPSKPTRVWRNKNNKLYMVFISIGAAFSHILNAILALRNRFNPLHCDESDLQSTAYMVGTHPQLGAGSILNITITNKSTTEQRVFTAGVYNYMSVSGMLFSFQQLNDYLFDPGEVIQLAAISRERGSYHVTQISNIKLFRNDGQSIDSVFVFSCADNNGQLGYPDEDTFAFRQRILNDGNRQDHIKELELKIRNLPNIFECNLIYNQDVQPSEYDGITLMPMELLVTITGVPTDEIAALVVEDVIYMTHKVDDDKVVYYESMYYINGKVPVYFKYHDTTDFTLEITYQYDQQKIKSDQVEVIINALLDRYVHAVTHVDTINEQTFYSLLGKLDLPNTKVLDVDIMVSDEQVPYLTIPKTRLPHLTGVTFHPVEIEENV